VVAFQVQAVAEASQALIVGAEYSLLILAWIVEAVDLVREEADSIEAVDMEATEDLLVATVETGGDTVETEDPLVEAAVEDSAEDKEEVSEIIEDISNAIKLDGNLNNDS